jgi:hypothetical protein
MLTDEVGASLSGVARRCFAMCLFFITLRWWRWGRGCRMRVNAEEEIGG